MSTEIFMTKALNNYNKKVIRNTWGSHSEEQRNIVTSRVDLNIIKDSIVEFSTSVLKKLKTKKQTEPRKVYDSNALNHIWRSIRGIGLATIKNLATHITSVNIIKNE